MVPVEMAKLASAVPLVKMMRALVSARTPVEMTALVLQLVGSPWDVVRVRLGGSGTANVGVLTEGRAGCRMEGNPALYRLISARTLKISTSVAAAVSPIRFQ